MMEEENRKMNEENDGRRRDERVGKRTKHGR